MVYKVKLDVFEGPFDLLLHLISRQKVDIRDVPLQTIADEYLAYIDRMKDLDLDVASDFLLVAATLMELKAASLLPGLLDMEDLDELTAADGRDVLIARLIEYRTCKNAAAELEARAEAFSKLSTRQAGLEDAFVGLLPDFLAEITLEELAFRCARLLSRREVPLIEASHIGGIPLSVERRIENVIERVRRAGRISFMELVGDGQDRAEFIVALLAILELYKRGDVELAQAERFGSIELHYVGEAA
jgi:segregation and condensation protein A